MDVRFDAFAIGDCALWAQVWLQLRDIVKTLCCQVLCERACQLHVLNPHPVRCKTFLTCLCSSSAQFLTDFTHVPVMCTVYCQVVMVSVTKMPIWLYLNELVWLDVSSGWWMYPARLNTAHGGQLGSGVVSPAGLTMRFTIIWYVCFLSSRELTSRNRAGTASREEAQPDWRLGRNNYHPYRRMLFPSQSPLQWAPRLSPPMARMPPMAHFTWSTPCWPSCKFIIISSNFCSCFMTYLTTHV